MQQVPIGLPQVFSMVLLYHSLDCIFYFVKKMKINNLIKKVLRESDYTIEPELGTMPRERDVKSVFGTKYGAYIPNDVLRYMRKNPALIVKRLYELYGDKLQEYVDNAKGDNPQISEGLQYHLDNGLTLIENVYRPHSESFFNLINEVRELYISGEMELTEEEVEIVESDLGKKIKLSNGKEIYLDIPMSEEFINEAEYNGKKVEIGKPRRNTGGGKKYVVYVKNPSTGRVKKISFGDVKGGLTAKVSNPKARKAFASRHQCDKKNDRMKAGYWACRLNRFGHLWGGKTYPGFW